MKIEIFIAVRGGLVCCVRCGIHRSGGALRTIVKCFVVDYDNFDCGGSDWVIEEDMEREVLGGLTWAEITKTSRGVF